MAVAPHDDPDDGADCNAEFVLAVTARGAFGTVTQGYEVDNFNWDDTRVWSIDSVLHYHLECTPMSPVVFSASLAEVDFGTKEVLLAYLLSAVRFAAAVTWGGPCLAAAAFYSGVASVAIVALNGNDCYGTGTVTFAEPGSRGFECRGSDDSADVEVRIETFHDSDYGQCDPPAPNTIPQHPSPHEPAKTEPEPEETIRSAFSPLHDIYHSPTSLEAESGNPAQLSDHALQEIGISLQSMILGWAQTMAAAVIQDAGNAPGIEEAVFLYVSAHSAHAMAARALSMQDTETTDYSTEQALKQYENAAMIAAQALNRTENCNGGGESDHSPLPFHFVLTPSYYSTRPNRTVELFMLVLGTGEEVEKVGIANLPSGMTVHVERLGHQANAFQISLALGDVAQGDYSLTVTVTAGGESTSKTLYLIVN